MKIKVLLGMMILAIIFGTSVVWASDGTSVDENQEFTAEQALQKTIEKAEGVIQEVNLTFEEDKNLYEIQIESDISEYEFTIDASSGEMIRQETNISTEEVKPGVAEESSDSDDKFLVNATSFKEYDTISNQVSIDNMTFQLVTDNSGKRVMYLVDEDGIKCFKTIFIKHDSHLKILDVKDGGLLYNDKLK